MSLPTEKTLLVTEPAHDTATSIVMRIPAGRPKIEAAADTATALLELSLSQERRM